MVKQKHSKHYILELEEELIKNQNEISQLKKMCDNLKLEVENYKKAFEDAKKERDNHLCEYQKKIGELKEELKSKDGTKMFETLMKNTSGEVKENLTRHMYGNLKCVLKCEKTADEMTILDFLPTDPIKIADMLINSEGGCEPLIIEGTEYKDTYKIFRTKDLCQIAQHLLVYCEHNAEENV